MADQIGRSSPCIAAPRLVGRERELAILRDALAAALAGRGALLLIAGEAGIGKTTLAEALLAEAAAQRALALTGRCYDLAETPPYGPWIEVFGGLPRDTPCDGLPSPLGDGAVPASQATFCGEVRDHLAALAARQPLVLLLEDLHWADPASLDLLRVVARGLAALPLLIIATYRADELTRHHPLYVVLPALVREARTSRLDLRPLSEADHREVVRGRYHRLPPADEARLAGYLHDHAEGNPLYINELLRSLEEERILARGGAGWCLGDLTEGRVPALLRQVIDGRVTRLGEAVRAVLAVGAVIGQEVPLDLWAAVRGSTVAALLGTVERAIEARILEEFPGKLRARFYHALIRETLYEGLAPSERALWHCRIGEALGSVPHPDPDAVAFHFRQAGDARAAIWLVRAGERAERAYAWLTAAERYEAALHMPATHGGAASDRAWLLYRLARLRRYAEPQRSIADLDEAARVAATTGDAALVGYARFDRGHLLCLAGQVRQGLAEMAAGDASEEHPADQPVAVLGSEGNTLSAQYRRSTRILWLGIAGHYDEALALASRLLAEASAAPKLDAMVCGNTYHGLGLAHAGQGRVEAARNAFEQAAAAYRSIEHRFLFTTARARLFRWVVLPYQTTELARRERLAQEIEATFARASGITSDLPPCFQRLPLPFLEGQWSEARELALAGQAPGRVLGMRLTGAHVFAQLALHQGEPDLAWAAIRPWLPAGSATPPGDCQFLETLILLRVAIALACDAGDLPGARSWLEAHDRWLAWGGTVLGCAEGQLGWATYHRASGDLALARQHAAQALAHASEPCQPLALLAAHRLLGELDTAAERLGDATTHLEAALALADACAAPYERALTLLALAELCLATGDRQAAVAALEEARGVCADLGARPALARIARLTAALAGARPARASFPNGLTAREVAVLRLVAQGRSNREIAGTLSISIRTVERHIENLYHKIAASGRADATAFAIRHHLA